MSIPARLRWSWIFGLLVGVLVVSMSVFGVYADEEQTPSEMAKIGYEHVGSVMSSVSGAEVDKSEMVKGALSNLFGALAEHLSEKRVPDHVVDKFESQSDSLLTLYENGLINSQQLGEQSSNIVKSAGRQDPEGKVSSSALKRAGMDDEKIQELAEKGPGELDGAEMAQEMARDRKAEHERVKEKEESRGPEQKKVNNRGADEREEKEEEKGQSEDNNNPGNSGKDKEEAKDESSKGENKNEKDEEKGKQEDGEKGNSEAGKPDETPGRDQGEDGAEGQNDDQEEVSSDQPQEGPGNSGDNPGNSGEVGEGNGDKGKGEKEEDENPGKSEGKGEDKGKGKSGK